MKDNKTQKLYDSITNIDSRFIEEAQVTRKKRSVWLKAAAIAACFSVIVAAAVSFPYLIRGEGVAPGLSTTNNAPTDAAAANTDEAIDLPETTNAPVNDDDDVRVDINASIPAEPQLYLTLYWSELVVSGEVIEKLPSYETKPVGTSNNWEATPYIIRVEEVYMGDAEPGDTVVVNSYKQIFSTSDGMYVVDGSLGSVLPLKVGQRAVFCLGFADDCHPEGATPEEVGHCVIFGSDGIYWYEPRDSKQIEAAEAAEHPETLLFASRKVVIDIDAFAEAVKEVEAHPELYKPNNAGVFKED